MCANLEPFAKVALGKPGRNDPVFCFEWVRAISVCGAEPFAKVALGKPGRRNALTVRLHAVLAPDRNSPMVCFE
jgi:hypothetical protein